MIVVGSMKTIEKIARGLTIISFLYNTTIILTYDIDKDEQVDRLFRISSYITLICIILGEIYFDNKPIQNVLFVIGLLTSLFSIFYLNKRKRYFDVNMEILSMIPLLFGQILQ